MIKHTNLQQHAVSHKTENKNMYICNWATSNL